MIAFDCADILKEAQLSDVYICYAKTRGSRASQERYEKKIKKEEEKIKYKRSLLPESGYMTLEEYEEKSRAKTRKEISEQILDKPDMPKDKNFIYVPQHVFKLVKYNEPVGSPELFLPRRLFFDRQINAQGIVSGDYKKLVYPSVYYYAEMDSIGCDLFLINLDDKLGSLERVKKANVLNKEQAPILSTEKETKHKSIIRTLTPIDYSSDNTKLLIKEKIGSRRDGIWKTDAWIYNFETHQAKNLTALRDAIGYYWKKTENLELNDKRWDIYPIGFDANNKDRIVACAYAFTGGNPKFLGTWSIDINNEAAKLESATDANIPISVVGFKISKEHDVRPISELEFEAKLEKEKLKKKSKNEAKKKKQEKNKKPAETKTEIEEESPQNEVEKIPIQKEENIITPKPHSQSEQEQFIEEMPDNYDNSQNHNEKFIKDKVEDVYIDEAPAEPVKMELPDLNIILEKFKRDAGITPEQEAENELYDLDELDNLEE